MKKFILILVVLFLNILTSNAKEAFSISKIEHIINSSPLSKQATIAISVKNLKRGCSVYERDSKKLLHSGSTLKIFSFLNARHILGEDYQFETAFYLDKENNLYLKLGADPLLTSNDLDFLISEIKKQSIKFNNLLIDDTILDKQELGIGWMWDDCINPFMGKVSSYNINKNQIKLKITTSPEIKITNNSLYPLQIINNLKKGNENLIYIEHYPNDHPETIILYGDIATDKELIYPIEEPRKYFLLCLMDTLKKYSIEKEIYLGKTPKDSKLVAKANHSLNEVGREILQNSNNIASETLHKITGNGNFKEANESLLKYFNEKDIAIADGSGISRNNLITADSFSQALLGAYSDGRDYNFLIENLPQPNQGTLENRFLGLDKKVWLKTGSLSGISGISGYVKKDDKNIYSVTILIQNFHCPETEAKILEERIIRSIID